MGRIEVFFDFHVHKDAQMVEEAAKLGFSGIALFDQVGKNSHHNNSQILYQFDFEKFKDKYSINLQMGVEIKAKNPEDMKKKVQKFRNKADVLLVYGGDLKINRAACEDSRVDIISHPYQNRRDCGINHVLARKAAENQVAIELNLRYLSKTRSYLRYKVLAHFREIIKLQRKFEFPVIITSDARSIYDLHTPQDIIALSKCFGMAKEEAICALSEIPQNIMKRSSLRNRVVIEGVKKFE